MSRGLLQIACFLCAILASAQVPKPQPGTWKVTTSPAPLVNGSPVLFKVTAPRGTTSVSGKWLDHDLSFRRSRECNCWYALGGVDLATKPARYPLSLSATGGREKETFTQQVAIAAKQYPTTAIKVAPEYVEPPKETLARIEEDQSFKKQAFAEVSPAPFWNGPFLAPTDTEVSGVFGSARTLNGTKKNQHLGLDFRATTGTPVHAANAGTVVIARPLYFEGNCVAIDHGQGLVTLYLHLSQFKVKEGERVTAGELIGLSGGTGRATGPHLHFAVRWQGIYLDPATLLKLNPPHE